MTLFNVEQAKLIVPGFHPDPSVCELERDHFLVVFSSFEYVPGLPIYESFDAGKSWGFLANALTRPSQYPLETMGNSRGIFAPTLRYHDGVLYLIVTNVNKGNLIITSGDEGHTWSEPIWMVDWPGIDPSIFIDDDGQAYICGNEDSQGGGGSQGGEIPGIYAAKIDLATGKILTGRHRLSGGITGANPEGPHMYKRAGLYYLMWAEGGTEAGHMECLARADMPFGDYEMFPGNPMMTNRSTHLSPTGIGHADLSHVDDDRTFMVFLGTRMNDEYPAQGWIGRESFCVWWEWDSATDWPKISDQSYQYDNSLEMIWNCSDLEDDTNLENCSDPDVTVADSELEREPLAWITPGVDREGLFDVIEDDDSLATGTTTIAVTAVSASPGAGFNNSEHVPFIGRRQYGFADSFEVVVTHLCQGDTGIVVYANHNHWISLHAVSDRSDGRIVPKTLIVCLTAHDGDLAAPIAEVRFSPVQLADLEEGSFTLKLRVMGDMGGFHFFAGIKGDEADDSIVNAESAISAGGHAEEDFESIEGPRLKRVGSVDGKMLSFANAGGFTGSVFGVYAHGEGKALFRV